MSVAAAIGSPGPGSSSPLERYLVGGRSRVGLKAGLAASLAAHVAMFGGALLYARLAPPRVIVQAPIVAHLVRLGTPRDSKLLPRLPSAATPPAAKGAKALPTVPNQKAPPKAPSLKQRAEDAIERQERLQAALDALGAPPDGPTAKTKEPPVGQKDGDALGDVADAAAGERYIALVIATLRRSFILPDTISEKERMYLAADVFIRIAPDGRILESRVTHGSGNPQFDGAILTGLQRMSLPPPPPAFLAQYKDGVPLHYHP